MAKPTPRASGNTMLTLLDQDDRSALFQDAIEINLQTNHRHEQQKSSLA